MTPKERAMACINGRKTDKVPVHHLQFSGDVARLIVGRECYVGGAYVQWRAIHVLWDDPESYPAFLARCEEDAVAVARACGHDILRLHYWRWGGGRPAKKVDDYNFIFGDHPDGRWHILTYDPQIELLTRKDYQGSTQLPSADQSTEVAEPTEESVMTQVEKEEAAAATYALPADLRERFSAMYRKYPDDLLKLGSETVGVDMNCVADMLAFAMFPKLVARIYMARARRCAKEIAVLAEAGMPVNFSGYDFCSKDGPCISPRAFREVVTPALKLIVDAAHTHGMKYFYSGDGNFWPVAEDFFDIAGIDGYFETDRSAGMELRPLRERFPKVTFIGNIRVQVLHRGTRDDVIRETMDCLEVAHELGGVIVGASNMIMPGTPPDNIMAMLETIDRNR
ncbi:MAG: uroporphyrinogen decarboxylase family protein [Phycisphaerae bacterium]